MGNGVKGWTLTQHTTWGTLFFGSLHWEVGGSLMCSRTTWYWTGP